MMKSEINPTAKSSKILIVEDEGDMSLLMEIMLSNGQNDLHHAKTLADAEEFIATEQPSLVLLDNKLPDGFGIDFVPTIKKLNPASKVIMVSGFDPAASDVAVENGADLFINKPFTRQQLLNAVNMFI